MHSYDSQPHNAAVGLLLAVVSFFLAVGTAGLGAAEGSFHHSESEEQPSQFHHTLLQTPPPEHLQPPEAHVQ